MVRQFFIDFFSSLLVVRIAKAVYSLLKSVIVFTAEIPALVKQGVEGLKLCPLIVLSSKPSVNKRVSIA